MSLSQVKKIINELWLVTLKSRSKKSYTFSCTQQEKNYVIQSLDTSIYVVVQFYPRFKFYFPLVMVMYESEIETKENKI